MAAKVFEKQATALSALTALEADQFVQSSQSIVGQLRQVLSSVAKVYTEGFDAEQVWEQLQLLVRACLWLCANALRAEHV